MSSKDALKVQLAYVVNIMRPLYDAIKVLQKQSGGIIDVMDVFSRYANP